uniref:EF-hand domain-containing protein n=1 Tax=Arcella intermedia TaxID=1963864 RepID=A0A6B2LNM2_9EUKA|eukprot:TRINITY_DN24361_c0_g1_i1.p1 TRINITY_DN24361_c0_g1~~TRINITY_DN24361_c0_g1_i1.p1  ORF type:complete len:177 (+),score=29.91 TRINITY_DN24361_c0_g1_i1:53-532(+)
MSEEVDTESLQKLFSYMDTNKDGQISVPEMCSYYARTVPGGCTIHDAKAIIEEINGAVNQSQSATINRTAFFYFKLLAECGVNGEDLETLKGWRQEFSKYDKDGNGLLSKVELKMAFHAIGVELDLNEIAQLVASIDVDRNGYIDFLEFVTLMKSRHLN